MKWVIILLLVLYPVEIGFTINSNSKYKPKKLPNGRTFNK